MNEKPDLEAQEREAIAHLARSRDGKLLHRYLRRQLENVVDGTKPGALRADLGRRSLARDLMRLMAQSVEETASDGIDSGDTILSGGNPARVARSPTFAEWSAANDPELRAERARDTKSS